METEDFRRQMIEVIEDQSDEIERQSQVLIEELQQELNKEYPEIVQEAIRERIEHIREWTENLVLTNDELKKIYYTNMSKILPDYRFNTIE